MYFQRVHGLALACNPESALQAMTDWLPEKCVSCPFCGEKITIIVDISAGPQTYVEDCQVCCQAMQITIEADGDSLRTIHADR